MQAMAGWFWALSGRVSELASGLTRNQVPRKGLWVRIPCPPLTKAFSKLRFRHL